MKRLSFVFAAALCVSGCGTMNNYLVEKTKTVEYYRIFDIKTAENRQVVSKAASDGLGRNVGNAQEAMPIPASGDVPETASRFKIVNPFEGSKIAVLAGGPGSLGLRMATCDGAIWTAKAVRNIQGSNRLELSACLFQYREGYHLDLYAIFTKQEGGLFQVSRDMANVVVGTPEEWTEKTFLDIVRSIYIKTDANITLLEAQPEISGTPWSDNLDTFPTGK